jgi:hypothetical protein
LDDAAVYMVRIVANRDRISVTAVERRIPGLRRPRGRLALLALLAFAALLALGRRLVGGNRGARRHGRGSPRQAAQRLQASEPRSRDPFEEFMEPLAIHD